MAKLTRPSKLKNKPAPGMKLHKFIALGGNPASYNSFNKTEALRKGSKQRLAK